MSEFCKFLSNGLVYNNDNTVFTVSPCCYYSDTFDLDINSDTTNQIEKYRKLWLTQDVERTCKVCIDMETSNIYSYRQASFDITFSSDAIEMLTVAVNKQCNLACPTCGPLLSSFWYQENVRNKVEQPKKIHQLHQSEQTDQDIKKFIDMLAQQDLTKLQYIKFGGGEPLMSDVHLEILKLIPSPQNVTVHYTSNFTIVPNNKIFEQWKKFKLIKWLASLDGIDNQFDLLRWPAKWSRIQQNVSTAIEIVPHNVMFGVEHTLNPLNIFYYDLFELWFNHSFKTNRYGDHSDLNLHICKGTMDLCHTPPGVRDMVIKKYGKNHRITQILEKSPWSGNSKGLVNYMDQLDQFRNTNWRTVFKEVEFNFD